MPLVGAYIADTYLGRYKTIHLAIVFAMIGHVVLTASAAPSVITNGHAGLGAFIVGLIASYPVLIKSGAVQVVFERLEWSSNPTSSDPI
jgi:dipeptide/tripeptide permease